MARVLLIDDSQLALEFQTKLLKRAGHEVRACIEMAEVAPALATFVPDAILLDGNMPDVTVQQACASLRADERTRSVPLLLYSGLENDDLAVLAAALHVDGYVSKSDPASAVLEKLKVVLARSKPDG